MNSRNNKSYVFRGKKVDILWEIFLRRKNLGWTIKYEVWVWLKVEGFLEKEKKVMAQNIRHVFQVQGDY